MRNRMEPAFLACRRMLVVVSVLLFCAEGVAEEAFEPTTRVDLFRNVFSINGKPTYAGTYSEGLLLNVRMVHAVFEDSNPASCPQGFDAEENTARFVKRIPSYVEHGIRAFTVNLQGGDPGYEGAVNSAFDATGKLRPGYMGRVASVIEACDRAGACVIVGCFSRWQDQTLRDESAVKVAVGEAARWVHRRGYKNVILEVADRHDDPEFAHEILREPTRFHELLTLAREAAPGVLVSASSASTVGRLHHSVAREADFLLFHFEGLLTSRFYLRASMSSKFHKAMVCTDDSKTGKEGAAALEAAVTSLMSWGYANRPQNEHYPFRFEGALDDEVVYAKFKELTTRR
jgi:hypothetical protein